jgi:hypothetical protein
MSSLHENGHQTNPCDPFPHWNDDPLIPSFPTPEAQFTHEHRIRNLPAEVESLARDNHANRLLVEQLREQFREMITRSADRHNENVIKIGRLEKALDEQRAEFGRLSRSVGNLFIQVNADGLRFVELQDAFREAEPRITELEGRANDFECWQQSEIKEGLEIEKAAAEALKQNRPPQLPPGYEHFAWVYRTVERLVQEMDVVKYALRDAGDNLKSAGHK